MIYDQDQENILHIKAKLQKGLQEIDKSGRPGKFKAWLFQYETPSKAHVATPVISYMRSPQRQ